MTRTKALGFYDREGVLDEGRLASHEGEELAAIVASFFPTIAKDILRVRCSGIIKPVPGRSLLKYRVGDFSRLADSLHFGGLISRSAL
jgi:hypothetical protein